MRPQWRIIKYSNGKYRVAQRDPFPLWVFGWYKYDRLLDTREDALSDIEYFKRKYADRYYHEVERENIL